MQHAEELQLFHVLSGSLAGKGGACMFYLFVVRGDISERGAPDTARCFAGPVLTQPLLFSRSLLMVQR